jgi:hypothetical protein
MITPPPQFCLICSGIVMPQDSEITLLEMVNAQKPNHTETFRTEA